MPNEPRTSRHLLALSALLAGLAASDAASAVVVDGDTVEIDAGVYAGEVCSWAANDLTLRGVGGRAWLQAPAFIPNGKAIWVIGGRNTLVENIEFSGAAVPDANCADPASTILIEFSEFARNGVGDGFSHDIYIGHVGTFILRHGYSHLAVVGHEVKSRADVNTIEYNRIMDEATGTASYSIDLPNGGLAYIIGNVIQQGPLSQNSGIISFAAEGASNPRQELHVVNNTIVNDLARGRFVTAAGTPSPCELANNIFWGGGTALTGAGSGLDVGAHEYFAGVTSYRGTVPTYSAGWRAASFPLSAASALRPW